jgi:uncharacterized membrane protein
MVNGGVDVARIERALEAAERGTSAEIRVAMSRWYFWGDVRHAAERAFARLHMTGTRRRNGVLMFLALRRRQFVLCGDVAVEEKLDRDAWARVAETLRAGLASGDVTRGIEAGITALGTELARCFPPVPGDVNELPDKVITDSP